MTTTTAFIDANLHNVGTTPQTLYTVPSNGTAILIGLNIANITGSGISVSVTKTNGVTTWYIVKNALIDVGDSLKVIDGDKLTLTANQVISVVSNTTTSADVTASLMLLTTS